MHKCKNCGYQGAELIFQFNDYSYCVATNEETPAYVSSTPRWVTGKSLGEADIGEPVGCPKCKCWGVDNFELL